MDNLISASMYLDLHCLSDLSVCGVWCVHVKLCSAALYLAMLPGQYTLLLILVAIAIFMVW